MKFSIVVPAYNSDKTIGRALDSLTGQSIDRDLFEIVVVNDASRDNTDVIIDAYMEKYPDFNWKLIIHDVNKNKAISRNDGMRAASGEWICWLDADDFYLPYYLEIMNQATEKYPDSKMFYYGGIIVWKRWDSAPRYPMPVHMGEVFRSGQIMSGGFMFKKECLDRCGYLPEERSPYGFGEAMLTEFPEVKELYKPGQLDLGNPWGDDWAMFYKLTRHFQPKMLNITPYVVVNREEHQL